VARSSRFAGAATWLLFTLGCAAAFAALAAYNLANYRPVTNDEVELIAVAYKLATRGVLGSDLYAGFYGADEHFFITLPVQHVLEAASFWLFGAGIAQARGVSVAAGVVIVCIVGWLAYRWYGLAAALLCELLLVAWPANLTAASNGLPLLGVARVARYDVLAVAFMWLALALLDVALRGQRVGATVLVGIASGLATLSQFLGVFVVPVIALNWALARAPVRGLLWVALGFAVVVAPWLLYGAVHASDVAGQLTVYAGRGEFLRPGFYVDNITQELGRYEHLVGDRAPSVLLLTLGLWPALIYVAWRSREVGAIGDRIVWTSLLVFAGLLLLLDHGKSSVYAIALWPSICLALSRAITGSVAWVRATNPLFSMRLLASALAVLLVLRVAVDGVTAYRLTLAQADAVSPYMVVGQQLDHAVDADARVLGPERWWWALRDRPYLSLRNVWWQWAGGAEPAFTPDDVIVNDNVRADVLLFPESVQERFWEFLRTCTRRVADLDDPNYFGIEVYRVLSNESCKSTLLKR